MQRTGRIHAPGARTETIRPRAERRLYCRRLAAFLVLTFTPGLILERMAQRATKKLGGLALRTALRGKNPAGDGQMATGVPHTCST